MIDSLPTHQEGWQDPLLPDGQGCAGGRLLGVRKEYLDAAFDEMEKNYGTIEKYFSESLGINAEQQQALRDLYLKQR
jgi:protein tyrosine/serine phosphatase